MTTAGLSVFPALAGPVPFDTGNYGYGAVITPGAPYTSLITDSAGNTLAGIYQHPGSGSQVGVAELSVYFNYNSSQLQWLLLAPGLVNWVTQGTHLGLYRNYFGQDIDDNFIADNEWSSQYQCTPGATEPSDYTCPALVANNPADTPPDVQMTAADVAYVVAWEQQTDFGDLIKTNEDVQAAGLSAADIDAAMDPRRHSAGRDVIFARLSDLTF